MQNQLAIRVQLKKPEAKTAAKDHLEIYWGRIAGVGLVAVVLVLAVYCGWRLMNQPPAAGKTPLAAVEPARLAKPETPATAPRLGPATSGSKVEVTVAPEQLRQAPRPASPTAPATSSRSPQEAPAALLPVLSAPAIAAPSQAEVGRAPVAANPPAEGAAQASAKPSARLAVLSEHVSSALLTDSRAQGLAGQPLGRQVSMAGRGLITLYLFTRYENLQGQWVFHDWYLNGEQVASVRARPHKTTMEVHSSKYIDRYMTGQWQVRVRTESGEQLATAEVEVVR